MEISIPFEEAPVVRCGIHPAVMRAALCLFYCVAIVGGALQDRDVEQRRVAYKSVMRLAAQRVNTDASKCADANRKRKAGKSGHGDDPYRIRDKDLPRTGTATAVKGGFFDPTKVHVMVCGDARRLESILALVHSVHANAKRKEVQVRYR